MSTTVNEIITSVNTFFRDSTTDSVSSAERYEAINEGMLWLMENTLNDHQIRTYSISYVPGIHFYKINSALADFLEPADLRRGEDDQSMPATRKASREMAEDIANQSSEFAFGIERKNGNSYAVINLESKNYPLVLATFDSLTADGGTWTADTSTSDMSGLAVDTINYTTGTGSLKFNITAAQSVNNRATLSGTISNKDLSTFTDNAIFTLDVFIPDVTYTTSITLYWGNDSSNYYSVSATTDMQGNAFSNGDNALKFDWSGATMTGTVTTTAIDYIRIDINYSASQGNDTGYRLDNLQICKPEKLTFYYLSNRLGTNSGGTSLYSFTATTDIPYFSNQYDYYRFAVAHKAASILFRACALHDDADKEEAEAEKALKPKQKIFQSSLIKEDRGFKAKGLNFNRRKFN